jgi:hypothetical protein
MFGNSYPAQDAHRTEEKEREREMSIIIINNNGRNKRQSMETEHALNIQPA